MRVLGWQRDRRDGTRALVVRALVSGEWKVLKVCWDAFDHRVNCFEVHAITQFVESSPDTAVRGSPAVARRWLSTGSISPAVSVRTVSESVVQQPYWRDQTGACWSAAASSGTCESPHEPGDCPRERC